MTARQCEYQFSGQPWIVLRPSEMIAEFEFEEEGLRSQLEIAHRVLIHHSRMWLIVQRLYGVRLLVNLSAQDDPIWTKKQACEELGISMVELNAELEGARSFIASGTPESDGVLEASARSHDPCGADLDPEEALKKHQFNTAMFLVDGRTAEVNEMERRWFGVRVAEFDPMLGAQLTGGLARQVLLSELQLRRFETDVLSLATTDPKRKGLVTEQRQVQSQYESSLGKLDEMSPWRANSQGKQTGRATVFSLIESVREYHAAGDRSLVDGIFSAAEIEILLRTSVQAPRSRYRFGLVTYLLEAKRGMLDPEWVSSMKNSTVGRLNYIWERLDSEARELLSVPVPDLEDKGPQGEYPPIELPVGLPDAPAI